MGMATAALMSVSASGCCVAMVTRLPTPSLKRCVACSLLLLLGSALWLLWLDGARTPLQSSPFGEPPARVSIATLLPALPDAGPVDGGHQNGSVQAEQQDAKASPVSSVQSGVVSSVVSSAALPAFVSWSPPDGPGEYGQPYRLVETELNATQQTQGNALRRLHGFDQLVSDRISVRRRLPDPRPPLCRQQRFGALPDVSVVMCFYNEAWSVLLRSLHSVLERSPPLLLREVILVDDGSDLPHLGRPLERYVTSLEKVRLIRMTSRQGLAAARVQGARQARGTILVVLDSHIECFPGWLEPLLERLVANGNAVAWPVLHTIQSADFSVEVRQEVKVGGLSPPSLSFTWLSLPSPSQPALPLPSPTMPGGLFAMDRNFFFKLGAFDPDLHLWGGENLELSLKVWMCGGRIELVPCSRVAHIFRWRSQVGEGQAGEGQAGGEQRPWDRNTARVSEVWMDSYKALFFGHPNFFPLRRQMGDVTSRKRLRASLGCRDFRWYHEHVYPQLSSPVFLHFGLVQSAGQDACLDYQVSGPRLVPCNDTVFSQVWTLEKGGRLAHQGRCLAFLKTSLQFQFQPRPQARLAASWNLTQTQQMRHGQTGHCLQAQPDLTLAVRPCQPSSANQRWRLIAL